MAQKLDLMDVEGETWNLSAVWICHKHWALTTKTERKVHLENRRALRKNPTLDAVQRENASFKTIKDIVIQRAAGIKA